MRRAQVITASNRASKGEYQDTSGEILATGLSQLGYQVNYVIVVPDDVNQIQNALRKAIADKVDLIVTTGGTGISPTDVTPEATLSLIEKLYQASLKHCAPIRVTKFQQLIYHVA